MSAMVSFRMDQAKGQVDARGVDGGLFRYAMLPMRLKGTTHRQQAAVRQRQMKNLAAGVVADIETAFGAQAE